MKMLRKMWGIWLALTITLLTLPCSAQMTSLHFGLSNAPFFQNPWTNRQIRIQPIQPFNGSFIFLASNTNGDAYFSNAPASTYNGLILAPPSSLPFSFTVTATNLGLIDVSNIISIPGNAVQTIPTGQAAWPIYVSDARYAFNTNGGGNAPLSAVQTTNLVVGVTNGQTSIVSSNPATYINTNQLPGLTNQFATLGQLTNATNQINANGISATTATNITQAILILTNANHTTLVNTNPSTVVYTNVFPGITNAFPTSNYVSGNFLRSQSGAGSNNMLTNLIITGTANQLLFFDPSTTTTNTLTISSGALSFTTTGANNPGNNGADFTITSNQISAGNIASKGIYIGNGSGLTNTGSTNLAGYALTQVQVSADTEVTNIFMANLSNGVVKASTNLSGVLSQNQVNSSSNLLWGLGTNYAGTNGLNQANTASNAVSTANISTSNRMESVKLNATNGISTNLVLQGNVVFNQQATNITADTNLLGFVNAGSPNVTNAVFEWISGQYTNKTTGALVTNNGSAWLYNTNGVTLYAESNASPVNSSWIAISGSGSPASLYGFDFYYDRMRFVGFPTASNSVSLSLLNSTSNTLAGLVGGGNATNAIPLLNGHGTNTVLLWTNFAAWGGAYNTTFSTFDPAGGLSSAILSGQSNVLNYPVGSVIVGGLFNGIEGPQTGTGGDFGDFIGGGYGNVIGLTSYDVIVGGLNNNINSLSLNSSILGGLNNSINWESNGVVIGGAYNSITNNGANGTISSSILGGTSNKIVGSYSMSGGLNTLITNDNSFVWSDGAFLNTTAKSQFLIHATNGVAINTNYANGNALAVQGSAAIQGTASDTLHLTPTEVVSNLSIGLGTTGGSTNFYASTNLINVYQAGTSFCTNGTYQWIALVNCYTNQSTTAIITNNGSQWLLKTNGITLYNSTLLISNSWTAASGSGTASSCYGFYHLHNGELDLGGRDVTTNNGTSWNQVLYSPSFSGQPVISFGQWQNVTNPVNNSISQSNTVTAVVPVTGYTNGGFSFTGPITNNGPLYNFGNIVSPTILGPTNIATISVLYRGTNFPFAYTNGTYQDGINLSNAAYFANLLASNGLATGTYSNCTIQLGSGNFVMDYFDGFHNSLTMALSNGINFKGAGVNETFLGWTNVASNDEKFPFPFSGAEVSGFSSALFFAGNAADGNNGGKQNWYHNLALGGHVGPTDTNWSIDCFWATSQTGNTNLVEDITADFQFDFCNIPSLQNNPRDLWTFNRLHLTGRSTATSQSLVVRGFIIGAKRPGFPEIVSVNNSDISINTVNTNSPNLISVDTTNEAAIFELPSVAAILNLNNDVFSCVTTSGVPNPIISFTNSATGSAGKSNIVYIDNATWQSFTPTSILWAATNGSNAIVIQSPPGYTNFILDGVTNMYLLSTATITNPVTSGAVWQNTNNVDGFLSLVITTSALTDNTYVTNTTSGEWHQLTNYIGQFPLLMRLARNDSVIVTNQNGSATLTSSRFRP